MPDRYMGRPEEEMAMIERNRRHMASKRPMIMQPEMTMEQKYPQPQPSPGDMGTSRTWDYSEEKGYFPHQSDPAQIEHTRMLSDRGRPKGWRAGAWLDRIFGGGK